VITFDRHAIEQISYECEKPWHGHGIKEIFSTNHIAWDLGSARPYYKFFTVIWNLLYSSGKTVPLWLVELLFEWNYMLYAYNQWLTWMYYFVSSQVNVTMESLWNGLLCHWCMFTWVLLNHNLEKWSHYF
jgi:hypothetical protein